MTTLKSEEKKVTQTLSCKITLGPLTIETEANLDQVAELILQLVKEYRVLPKVEPRL
jgi:hypothetical protein